jgi:hypothetical protein
MKKVRAQFPISPNSELANGDGDDLSGAGEARPVATRAKKISTRNFLVVVDCRWLEPSSRARRRLPRRGSPAASRWMRPITRPNRAWPNVIGWTIASIVALAAIVPPSVLSMSGTSPLFAEVSCGIIVFLCFKSKPGNHSATCLLT